MSQPESQLSAPAPPVTLSTREVARLLGVGEATVKRWSDDGLLECRKTPGGHRRFSLGTIAEFRAKRPGWTESWPTEPHHARERLLTRALAGDGEGLTKLVMAGIDAGLSVDAVCDAWLSPMLVEVGRLWQAGELAVAQEHVVSATVAETFSQIAPFLQAEPVEGVALTACISSERHDLGARMAGLVLRAAHLRVIHTGADTPVDDLLAEVEREKASILCIGAQMPVTSEGAARLAKIGSWATRRGVSVFAGGSGFVHVAAPEGVEVQSSMKALSEAVLVLRTSGKLARRG